MAADRPLAERGLVEIKMGRSKFPGKPSKIGNRKRVNLSSCALPEENDSSKAAKNIYLGLSVFNETFGDNEMIAPGPFYGFSMSEVEEALAEARLQQKEAEVEHKNQGIDINLWDIFQNELFSIKSCSASSNTSHFKHIQMSKSKLSFDGGGPHKIMDTKTYFYDNSDKRPSKFFNNKKITQKSKKIFILPEIKFSKSNNFQSPRLKFKKLLYNPKSKISLQTQAAKKLLEKAKWCNLFENNKNAITEKKFILPSHSIHSSRIIKPNKKFIEENIGYQKFLKCSINKISRLTGKCSSNKILSKAHINNSKKEFDDKEATKKIVKKENPIEGKLKSLKNLNASKTEVLNSNTGKIILREPKLQLDKSNISMLEGPFSTPSAFSLNLNSHLKVSPMQSVVAPGSKMCGVCGVVKFYNVVDIPKKFGIYCCEVCEKFISKIIKSFEEKSDSKLQCLRGDGLCGINPIIKNQNCKIKKSVRDSRCEACWLQICLKKFKIPVKLKQKLLNLLPVNMQMNINLEIHSICNSSNQNFKLSNNIDDFKWLNENSNIQNMQQFKDNSCTGMLSLVAQNEKSLRKRTRIPENENDFKHSGQHNKVKTDCDEKIRQHIVLKGPRVKHVCRSASVALGQPLAVFCNDASPNKKQASESTENYNNCDDTSKSKINMDVQKNLAESNIAITITDTKEQKDKKFYKSKEFNNAKNKTIEQNKLKKKSNVKIEEPVSMDFWECYDPEEICETGFGLIGSENFSVRAFCFLCGSSGLEKLIHCASCCEPYHEFCIDEAQLKIHNETWRFDWICPSCTVCITCGKTSGQQLKCVKCENSYHTECVDRVGGRLLHSPDRPWVCSACLRCKSCYGIDVSIFVGNLPLCKSCFVLRQKGNYCPLCQRCYEDDDYDSKMMECGQCKCWVHAKCEGLSDEKYQVLSFLPESVEYVCRMCCVIPPAPWWLAIEAELKSGYLGVLKALSKNRKACTMLKWSPRKQCTCRQVDFMSRKLEFDDSRFCKDKTSETISPTETASFLNKEKNQTNIQEKEKFQPASVSERKASIEVINHPTESLKMTLKITKGVDLDVNDKLDQSGINIGLHENETNKYNKGEYKVRVKKCPLNEENEYFLTYTSDCREESLISVNHLLKKNAFNLPSIDLSYKKSLSSPLNPPSDSGIGSTDDELKTNCLTDEESCRMDEQQADLKSLSIELKSNCDTEVSSLTGKRECFCFLEIDSYNSRSKPFSPNLMSIKKKVTTSEYSSLQQFHQDMERMIETTHSVGLMDLYHQTIKEIFPWFDPKYSRVQNSSQKVVGSMSLDSTPVKNTPVKSVLDNEFKILKEKLREKPLDYFYNDYVIKDVRICSLCKAVGDGLPSNTGRLLYCGQNEWVHCNCALWSGEVFEEIDGSLQNVHSAINRGRSIRCPECNLKGASIGCCARNCQETYHFSCARKIGCSFMDDKTMYCPLHAKDNLGKLVQNEKDFEIRRPVYVELDKKKMKSVDRSQIRFAVGALQVNNLGKFIAKLSDQSEAIVPEQFSCSRLYWSCFEPWKLVRYHFTVRLVEAENTEGFDSGINFTIDHSDDPESIDLKLKQLKHFQEHCTLLEISEKFTDENVKTKVVACQVLKNDEKDLSEKGNLESSSKKHKVVKRIIDHFENKDEENCLSDNQNTADLLPPDLEEAIFKDLPNDILDGISMQDIFMDIKSDAYENNSKDEPSEDSSQIDDNSENLSNKIKKAEDYSAEADQNQFWADGNCYNQDLSEDSFLISKTNKNMKKIKFEEKKDLVALKAYQKSCKLNWNCKTHGATHKKKRNSSKCHVTVNFLEPQERGNMLQELKFTDGLVSITTGSLGSAKDIKSRLDENKRTIQEEGKENKCLPWQTRTQPRLLQVDGGIDSSSSGSEAGESPQRMMDESINSKSFPESSTYLNLLKYPSKKKVLFCSSYFSTLSEDSKHSFTTSTLRVNKETESFNEKIEEEEKIGLYEFRKRQRCESPEESLTNNFTSVFQYKINQCDGGVDSDCEEDVIPTSTNSESESLKNGEEEPVKCSSCHCTYRTKISYQRHLESCNSDFILSSSEGEMTDDESSKKHSFSTEKSDKMTSSTLNGEKTLWIREKISDKLSPQEAKSVSSPAFGMLNASKNIEKLEIKKEKGSKKTYLKKKMLPGSKKHLSPNNSGQQIQQIVVPQTGFTPTLIIQDVNTPNTISTAFVDPTPTVGYVAAIDSQNPFGKTHVMTAPNGIISGNYQFPALSENQVLGSFCLNPQNLQAGVPGFIIQQPHSQSSLISPQPAPVMMTSEQILMGSTTGLIQDTNTGGIYLTNYSHPVFYNMETIISNTVMQTNQFISNVLATTYSQTSTQIFRTSEMEQMTNLPSNYIVVGPNPLRDELICVSTPQTFIPNQIPIQVPNQNVVTPSISTIQTFNSEAKVGPTQISTLSNAQHICSPVILSKLNSTNAVTLNQPINQMLQKEIPNIVNVQAKPKNLTAPVIVKNQVANSLSSKSLPKPAIKNLETKVLNKTLWTSKSKPLHPKTGALVDYINNFRSDISDALSPDDSQISNAVKTKVYESQISKTANYSEPKVNMEPQIFPLSSKTEADKPLELIRSSKCYLPSTKKKKVEMLVPTEKLDLSKTTLTNFTTPAVTATTTLASDLSLNLPNSNISTLNNTDDRKETTSKVSECYDDKVYAIIDAEVEKNDEIKISDPEPETQKFLDMSLMNDKISEADHEVLENKVKQCLNMPLLDEPNPIFAAKEDFNQSPKKLESVKDKNAKDSLLPLKENNQTNTNTLKNTTFKNCAANDPKNLNYTFKGKVKNKKRFFSSNDQNLDVNLPVAKKNEVSDKAEFEKQASETKKLVFTVKCDIKAPKLMFDVVSDDGFKSSSTSMVELWTNICESVQEMRASLKIPAMPVSRKGYQILGMHNHGLQHCLEQLKGVEQCVNYKCKYFIKEKHGNEDPEEEIKGNPSGCARTEKFMGRKDYDMFAWLASKHRQLPKLTETAEETLSSIRRANNLPMAMRYRNLKETAKLYVGVYRSKIHGRGLFCLREIEAGEMVIEYAGEVIRSNLTDKREKYYTDRGIGCYMFRIDDHFVVDATMKGNAARFINHSCEPNCYSRVVDILGKKHIVIFALRRINLMEELTYDYKFPFEDEKISCHCLSKKCKKYLN